MSHFTYADKPSKSALRQGDIIKKSDEIIALLRRVHPHFHNNHDNKYYIILTQSCDLVRRSGRKCSAKYINIAPVRPLSLVLETEVDKLQKANNKIDSYIGICDDKRRGQLVLFLQRLLNNNERDYFFLCQEDDLDGHYCAFLKLSIPIKRMHYNKLLRSKILELSEPFQNKLGYLIGDSFSRVGTEEWEGKKRNKDIFKEIIKNSIKDLKGVFWLQDPMYKKIIEKVGTLNRQQLKTLDIPTIINDVKREESDEKRKKREEIRSTIEKVLQDANDQLSLKIDTRSIRKMTNRIIEEPVLKNKFST